MNDTQALRAIEGLVRVYNAERRNRSVPTLKLSPLALIAFERVKPICDAMIGNTDILPSPDTGHYMLEIDRESGGLKLITHDELIACLRRIAKSIKRWNKQGGRRGYHEFTSQFLAQ